MKFITSGDDRNNLHFLHFLHFPHTNQDDLCAVPRARKGLTHEVPPCGRGNGLCKVRNLCDRDTDSSSVFCLFAFLFSCVGERGRGKKKEEYLEEGNEKNREEAERKFHCGSMSDLNTFQKNLQLKIRILGVVFSD